MQEILSEKLSDLADFLTSICKDDKKKNSINESMRDMSLSKMMLFINFLDEEKIDGQIKDFIKLYSLEDSQGNKDHIKDYILYFIKVKNILNK